MPFRLRYLAHDLELPLGDFVVGRSAECQLSVDDPLVSRKHGLIRVRKEAVTVEDLGSRNGVLVNGARIEGQREIVDGDKLQIGSQEMTLLRVDDNHPMPGAIDESRRATQTLGAMYIGDLRDSVEPTVSVTPPASGDTSKVLTSFRLLGGVADKALAMGRADEAERILQALLWDIIKQARERRIPDNDVADGAARYAARLAGATAKGAWADYAFELFTLTRRLLPAPVVDDLYTTIRKVKSIDLTVLRNYVREVRKLEKSFGPSERFLLQRIEGLERLAALK
jgi:predicted component of type VI protein secretion system